MPRTLETINTYGTGNASLTTLTHVADPLQSLAIRDANGAPAAHLGPVWGMMAAAADLAIYSPRMHDDLHALQVRLQATLSTPPAADSVPQPMWKTDTPTITSTFAAAPGSGVAEQAGYIVQYDDLEGGSQALATWAQVEPAIEHLLGVKVTATSSATAGAYGAGALINSGYDVFKADRKYALIGYDVAAECGNVAVQGPDTSNYLYGGPGAVDPLVTRDWYKRLELLFGGPTIPIIKANNKGSTTVVVSHTTASTAVIVQLNFALLKAGF